MCASADSRPQIMNAERQKIMSHARRANQKDRRFELGIKRFFDICSSVIGLILCLPLSLLIAPAIAVSMGAPIIFKQERIGQRGRVFRILKFRTMTEMRDQKGDLLPDAQRLTFVGRVLRRTSLDELPEFLNVLRGDMSIVGPRPLLVQYRDLYSAQQWRRHEMRPGIAGPVLAVGRNGLNWQEKFDWDSWYVDNWSLSLDAQILLRTAWQVMLGRGVSAEGHATMPLFEGSREERNSQIT